MKWPSVAVGMTLMLTSLRVFGQEYTYEERVVAAVLMGEAWCQGMLGMTAVGEVICQRVKDTGKSPIRVVTARKQFSCLNKTTPDRLVRRFARYNDFSDVLKLSRRVCRFPSTFTGVTNHANFFTRKEERPRWSWGKKPVAVIGDHAFYRL